MPKNLAQPKKRGKIKATPFLDAFEVSVSESEVRILIKILVLKLSNLMTLIVRNCIIGGNVVTRCGVSTYLCRDCAPNIP